MKTFKTIAFLMMVFFMAPVQSAAFTGISGDIRIFGNIFLDNDANNDGSFDQAAGIGTVTEIRRNGDLLWSNVSSELLLSFSNFDRNNLSPGLGGTTQFSSSNGIVNFHENPLGTFQVTGDYLADSLSFSGGDLLLSLIGSTDSFGNVAVGQFNSTSYSSNGQLSVTGGSFSNVFDTNGVSGGADMSFNISGDNISCNNYDFCGTADLAGTVNIPEPDTLALMALGTIGLVRIKKK